MKFGWGIGLILCGLVLLFVQMDGIGIAASAVFCIGFMLLTVFFYERRMNRLPRKARHANLPQRKGALRSWRSRFKWFCWIFLFCFLLILAITYGATPDTGRPVMDGLVNFFLRSVLSFIAAFDILLVLITISNIQWYRRRIEKNYIFDLLDELRAEKAVSDRVLTFNEIREEMNKIKVSRTDQINQEKFKMIVANLENCRAAIACTKSISKEMSASRENLARSITVFSVINSIFGGFFITKLTRIHGMEFVAIVHFLLIFVAVGINMYFRCMEDNILEAQTVDILLFILKEREVELLQNHTPIFAGQERE